MVCLECSKVCVWLYYRNLSREKVFYHVLGLVSVCSSPYFLSRLLRQPRTVRVLLPQTCAMLHCCGFHQLYSLIHRLRLVETYSVKLCFIRKDARYGCVRWMAFLLSLHRIFELLNSLISVETM